MADIQEVDVLIVGTGPSGSSTALHLIQRNPAWAGRIVMVDKAVHPREKLCGGGITHLGLNTLARLGLSLETKSFDVREVRLLYQDKSYSFRGNPVFRIVRRDEFDHWLLQKAIAAGVTVHQGESVTDIVPQDDFVKVVTTSHTFAAKTVVAADGSRSFVRRRLKWDDNSRVARLIEVLTPEDGRRQPEFRDGIAIFDFSPMTSHQLQGYYWDFPSFVDGQPMMNRGVFDSRARPEREKADLPNTLRHELQRRQRNLDDYHIKGHPIRWWSKNGRFSIPRVILVGDAAGADPLMGEGIAFALAYGNVGAKAIDDAFARQDFSFASYRDIVWADGLFKQLELRTKLARFAYVLKYPWFFRLGWHVARWVIRLTPWHNPEYTAIMSPSVTLSTSSANKASAPS